MAVGNHRRNPSRPSREDSTSYARTCEKLKGWPRLKFTFKTARQFEKVIAARSEHVALEKAFREQLERWKDETAHLSSETKAIAHPSYLRIIGLSRGSTGHEIERLLLHELEAEPDLWFAALTAVTGEDPVKPEHDFDESVGAWLAWGREKGII